MNHIQILDTTLRDGMQTPGIGVHGGARRMIAQAIMKTEPDIIEIGFAANSVDYAYMPGIAQRIMQTTGYRRPQVCGFARLRTEDIDKTSTALARVPAEYQRVHLFVPASDIVRTNSIGKTRAQVLDMICRNVSYAKQRFRRGTVQFSLEDASRDGGDEQGHYRFLVEASRRAYESGATVINIPDTTGWCPPRKYGELVRRLIEDVPGVPVWSVHVHNDSGQAAAATLEAVMAGATQVEGTVLGIGERAGNADWMTVAANLHVDDSYGAETLVNLRRFKRAAHDVARYCGLSTPRSYPIVGCLAHQTSSGVHANAVRKDTATYHVLDPADVGFKQRLSIGQTSGIATIEAVLQEHGLTMPAQAEAYVHRVKMHCAKHNGHIDRRELVELQKGL